MKAIITRSIFTGMLLSVLLTMLLFIIFTYMFPLQSWLDLIGVTIWNIPFILFVLLVSLLFGASAGFMIGVFGKNQLEVIEKKLHELANGNADTNMQYEGSLEEIDQIMSKMKEVKRYIQEQTIRTQNLVSERVENQQEQIEKVITEERNRLARELHDSVSQELFAASMLVSAINESSISKTDAITTPLQQIETMIQQAQLEMRALLLHLRPIALKDNSLKQGMDQLLQELDQKIPIAIHWKVEEVSLSAGVEDHLFRILQEALSNALRHAKASTMDIIFIHRDQTAILRVLDDGIGFNLEEKQSSSYGLANMSERAAEIGGKLRIVSVPNKGTRLEVRVPIINAEGDGND